MSKNQRKYKSAEKHVNPTMNQLATLLREVESMKTTREQFTADASLSATDRMQRLDEMDHAILMAEHMALGLMQKEIEALGGSDKEDSEECGGYFVWTDPTTAEEAWKHIQGLIPEVDHMKAKIIAVELDRSIPLSVKAEKLSYMKEFIQFVQLRIVELSEHYLHETKNAA